MIFPFIKKIYNYIEINGYFFHGNSFSTLFCPVCSHLKKLHVTLEPFLIGADLQIVFLDYLNIPR